MITCVDNVLARETANKIQLGSYKYIDPFNSAPLYWLDLGNTHNSYQVVLGTFNEVKQPKRTRGTVATLPSVMDLHPDMKKFEKP